MLQDFNPYREWLGITSTSASPNYYEMLGLRPLEADIGKINAAYQRQSSQLAARLSGSQAALAQRMMGELAEARITLMTPTAKRVYDQALASRGPVAPVSTVRPGNASPAGDVQDILPPAASTQAPAPTPVASPSGGAYAAPQAYPAFYGQPGRVAHPASPVVPGYYVPPQAAASAPVIPLQHQAPESMPTIRRRPPRRRSSPVPALLVTAVVVACVLGGMSFYFKGNEIVAFLSSSDATSGPASPSHGEGTKGSPELEKSTPAGTAPESEPSTPNVTQPPPSVPDATNDLSKPVVDAPDMTADEPGGDAKADKPAEEAAGSPAETAPAKDPQPDKPIPDPKPSEAGPEEAAAVAQILKDLRAALASRELAKAKDLLDEATIEATAPDTRAQVDRVEMLTNYVDMFWDAARKMLPKLEAAETIEIDGKEMAIVEADENHLVLHVGGHSKEYAWAKIPTKIAYYLADRSLTPDEPMRNLALAAFEIVEPKGDRAHAESLLNDAAAARLNVGPLYDELKTARGG